MVQRRKGWPKDVRRLLKVWFPFKCLTKFPISWCNIIGLNHLLIPCGHLERQALPHQHHPDLPILSPVARHLKPLGVGALNLDIGNIPNAPNIEHQHKYPIPIPLDLKLDPSSLMAPNSTVLHRNDPGLVFGNPYEHGHGQVEVLQRRVAPVSRRLAVIRRAEVGCSYCNGASVGYTPLWVVHTLDLKSCSAAKAIVEERCAQGRGLQSVSLFEEITISTSTFCNTQSQID